MHRNLMALQLVFAVTICSNAIAFSPPSRPFVHRRSPSVGPIFALPPSSIAELKSQGYCVIPNFLPHDLQESLRDDVALLRSSSKFAIAKIGQDSTNSLNQEIRVAETCFLGVSKKDQPKSAARDQLYQILSNVRVELATAFGTNLDANLDELLYAYYPQGGFYRRHRDAIPGSASILRSYSLLLYLNEGVWNESQGGQLRLHMDSGGDFLPEGEEPTFVDILPQGGTLVLLQSDLIPHEVLDTKSERIAVVGWYNRAVSVADIANLAGEGDKTKLIMLGVAAALVTVGLVNILA